MVHTLDFLDDYNEIHFRAKRVWIISPELKSFFVSLRGFSHTTQSALISGIYSPAHENVDVGLPELFHFNSACAVYSNRFFFRLFKVFSEYLWQRKNLVSIWQDKKIRCQQPRLKFNNFSWRHFICFQISLNIRTREIASAGKFWIHSVCIFCHSHLLYLNTDSESTTTKNYSQLTWRVYYLIDAYLFWEKFMQHHNN
jgi:hypothetical protein